MIFSKINLDNGIQSCLLTQFYFQSILEEKHFSELKYINHIFLQKFTNNQYLVLWIKAERGSGFSCLSRIFSSSSDSSPSLSNLELAMLKYTKHSIWQTHKNSATSLDILCLFLVAIVPLSCKVFFATVTFFSETNHFFT